MFVLVLLCVISTVDAHPERKISKGHKMSLQKLTALRRLMSQQNALAAYIIPTSDAHNSEYIAPVDARREWISGFTGSAGTAVVTATNALVWTDGRYYTQFEKEVDLGLWTLMKQSLPDTPSLEKWLVTNLVEGDIVGVDPYTMSREDWTPLQTALKRANMQIIAVKNLVDEAMVELNDPRPKRPHNEIVPLPVRYTGKTAGTKIAELRQKMVEKKATVLVISALDEVAYTLNIRGSDIQYNPVFFSYLIITPTSVDLFWGDGQLSDAVKEHLRGEGVECQGKPYDGIVSHLQGLVKELSENGDGKHTIWLSNDATEAIYRAASGGENVKKPLRVISEVSPVALAKLIKNDVELEGFRQCHIRDGIAVVRFFRWLHDRVDSGEQITEIQAADKLLEFRKDEADFMGPSFETIAGAGENGAIIHYSPSREGSQRVIRKDDMFLLDSGGQYKDGTTDITRTRHMGAATREQRDAFTRVLRGQLTVGSALFPQGVKGNVLDSFARKALWDVGLDYGHGTGHGVGHYLNVHEGPSGVSWRPYPHDPGLKPGQILSNEPGYYKVGEYGIRHEDLVETVAITRESKHPRLSYINSYHSRVLNTLGPILKKRGLVEDLQWLERECRPM